MDEILALSEAGGEQVGVQVREQVEEQVEKTKCNNLINALYMCRTAQKREPILKQFGLTNLYKNYQSHIQVLIDKNLLEMTIPEKPKSSNQKYRTTEKGNLLLEMLSEV